MFFVAVLWFGMVRNVGIGEAKASRSIFFCLIKKGAFVFICVF
jgi:hypothetical protein